MISLKGPGAEGARQKFVWPVVGAVGLVVLVVGTAAGCTKNANTTTHSSFPAITTAASTTAVAATAAPTSPSSAAATTTRPLTGAVRHVTGKAVTVGAGTFAAGKDVPPGLYDVTTVAGQTGTFVVGGRDQYNELLGVETAENPVVRKIRVRLSIGDSIQISGLSSVTFTPVTAPLVSADLPATLYAGTWTVGQDIGPGRYVATATHVLIAGHFIVDGEHINAILGVGIQGNGENAVRSVTVDLKNGDVITITGLNDVIMTPQ
jgi:hypothetical protein